MDLNKFLPQLTPAVLSSQYNLIEAEILEYMTVALATLAPHRQLPSPSPQKNNFYLNYKL